MVFILPNLCTIIFVRPFLFDHFCTTIFVWPFLRLVSYEPLSVSWHYELTKIRILSVLILSLRLKSCVYNWDRRRFFILSSLKTGVEYLSERVELIDWISMVIIKISSSSIHNQLKPNFSLLDVKYILFIFHFFHIWVKSVTLLQDDPNSCFLSVDMDVYNSLLLG